jgi:hypothetical protein
LYTFSRRGNSRKTSNPIKGLSERGGMGDTSSVGAFDHAMATVSKEGGGRVFITDLFLFQKWRSYTDDLAQAFAFGLVEPGPDEVGTVGSGIGARGRGGKGLWRNGGISKME